jgi:hypothetical protein
MADNLTTFMCRLSRNLGASTFWNPKGLSRPVMALLYILHLRWRDSLVVIITTLRAGRRVNRFSFSPKRPDRLWGQPILLFNEHRGSLWRVQGQGREVDHSPPSMSRLRMSGAIGLPLLPVYVFMALVRKTLLLNGYVWYV